MIEAIPEEKSSIELVYQKNINYERYKWKYLLRANVLMKPTKIK